MFCPRLGPIFQKTISWRGIGATRNGATGIGTSDYCECPSTQAGLPIIDQEPWDLRLSPPVRSKKSCADYWPRQPDASQGMRSWNPLMIPWLQMDSAVVPGAHVELRLMRRGDEFSMMLGDNELMNSRLSGSEEALATLACKRIEGVKRPHILIGGLGMGFTLRAALAVLGPEARIVVAELVPAVIAWARGPMARLFGSSLSESNIHTHDDLPIVLAGRANGQLKGNRHLVYRKETPLNNLFLNMFDLAGLPEVNGFGDSTGRLTDL